MPSGSVGSGSAIQCGDVRVGALGQRWVWLAILRLNLPKILASQVSSWGHSRLDCSLDALAIWPQLDVLEAWPLHGYTRDLAAAWTHSRPRRSMEALAFFALHVDAMFVALHLMYCSSHVIMDEHHDR